MAELSDGLLLIKLERDQSLMFRLHLLGRKLHKSELSRSASFQMLEIGWSTVRSQ